MIGEKTSCCRVDCFDLWIVPACDCSIVYLSQDGSSEVEVHRAWDPGDVVEDLLRRDCERDVQQVRILAHLAW